MEWHKHIYSNSEILSGRPIVRGTRLSVEFILGLFANGWTEAEVLENYPRLTSEDVRAIFAFAAEIAAEQRVYQITS